MRILYAGVFPLSANITETVFEAPSYAPACFCKTPQFLDGASHSLYSPQVNPQPEYRMVNSGITVDSAPFAASMMV